MSRETRLIGALAVIAVVGVSSLLLIANQYRKAIGAHPVTAAAPVDAAADGVRLVDGFVAARRAARSVASRYPGGIRENSDATYAYRAERSKAFSAYGMTMQDYIAVRSAWRAKRSGRLVPDPSLAAALERRPAAIEDGDLGDLEAVDDAIK